MKFLRSAIVAATCVTVATMLPASASSAPTIAPATLLTLPSGSTGVPQGYLPALTCPSVGNCEAGGAYSDATGHVQGLLLRETGGIWGAPLTLKAPAGASASPGITIYDLSCGAIGDCAVVGSYLDQGGNTQAFIANEQQSVWLEPKKVTLPANALAKGQSALVRSVVCSSSGNCSAVGNYDDNNHSAPRDEGFVLSEVHGVWQRAAEITTVAKSNFNPFLSMNQIACSSAGNCVAVGSFIDANDVTQGLLVDETNGSWRRGLSVALPANASAYADASLSEVTCVVHASCAVLGTYLTTSGALEGMSASETNDQWRRAQELTMPSGAETNPHVFLYGFSGIACASTGNCSAGGQYEDSAGLFQGFLVNENAGTWTSAVALSLPAGARSTGKNGGVIALTCPSVGNCRAGAAYLDASNNYQALVAVESNGNWQTGTKVVLPADAATVGVDGGLYSLVCLTTSSCTGVGSFLKTATTYAGFAISS